MAEFIDETLWLEALEKPDWYLRLGSDYKSLKKRAEKEADPVKAEQLKEEIYSLVEAALQDYRIPLAKKVYGLDKERQPVNTAVIHHTKNPPGMTLERLNAMHLLRIYGTYFANPTDPREKHLKGEPVGSDHFHKGRQVLWGYHWLVRTDGSAEQILEDKYIGWHAGNWDINRRSIGICIDDDLSEKEPDEAVIQSIAKILRDNYESIKPDALVGHCDVNKQTECPGHKFRESWRQKLIRQMY